MSANTYADPARVELGKLAYACRPDVGTPATRAAARRDIEAIKLERAIRRAVEAAPPLTAQQRAKLAAILTGGAK